MDEQKKAALSEEEISQYPENVQEALRQGLPLNIVYRTMATRYTRIKPPDKDLLAEYVVRAKGPERSMRQFAEEIGVNASTLSRIVNKKTVGANSDSLIADIAANADKNSGITFEMLMQAHGMENTDVRGNGYLRYEREVERSLKSIVIDALLGRGYSVTLREPIRHKTISGRFVFDMDITTNAIQEEDGLWGFDFCMMLQQPSRVTSGSVSHQIRMRGYNLMRRLMRLSALFADYNYEYKRVSLVTVDSDAFYEAAERLKECYLKYAVTLVLVNLETGNVDDEFMIPWIGEAECKPVFTPLPEPEDEEMDEDDLWDDDFDDPK